MALKYAETIPKEFWLDREWGFDHYATLARHYASQWVAIANRKVVASSKNLGEAEIQARKKTGKVHIPVLFIEKGGHVY